MGALAPRRGTGIQQTIARLRLQQGGDPLGAAVLHTPQTMRVARQCCHVAGAAVEAQALGEIRQGSGRHPGGGQECQHGFAIGPQAVHPQIERRREVGGKGEGIGALRRQPIEQGRGNPIGQGVPQSEGLRRVGRKRQTREGIRRPRPGPCPQHRAQHPVHHRGQPTQPSLFGQLHRGAHRRRGGHPLEEEQLVQADMEKPAQLRRLALGRHAAVGIKPGVQEPALTDGAVEQIGGQGPVDRRQGQSRQFPLQGGISPGARGHRLQRPPSRTARCQAGAGGRRRGGGGGGDGHQRRQRPPA
jgi:hypothetical protein